MRSSFIFCFFLLAFSICNAQLKLSTALLDFGKVHTRHTDSLPLTLTNTGNTEILFDSVVIGPRYAYLREDLFFSVHRLSDFIHLKAGESKTLYVRFTPLHNVRHRSQIGLYMHTAPGSYAVTLQGDGVFANSYYDSTFNRYDESLKSALNKILSKGAVNLGYNSARDAMYATIDNSMGQVECVYTGRKASFNTRAGATSNNFNCEHTFPQGFFGQNEPMRADIHHLFSTDETANNKRDNDPFGVVSNPSWSVGGSKWANSVFEPRDVQKGATARAMLYFVTRYQDYTGFMAPQESLLRQWHRAFMPVDRDSIRNQAVFQVQKNRNPFIDYPQLEQRIASFCTVKNTDTRSVPVSANTSVDFGSINDGDSVVFQTFIAEIGNRTVQVQFTPTSNNWIKVAGVPSALTGGQSVMLLFKAHSGNMVAGLNRDSAIIAIGNTSFKIKFTGQRIKSSSVTAPSISSLTLTNPALGYLHFSGPLPAGTGIWLTDLSGRMVFFTEFKSALNDIELPVLVSGCYFVTVKLNNRLRHFKVQIP